MRGNKKHLPGRLIRLLFLLLLISVFLYACIIGFICISERSVLKNVPNEEEYDAIIVLGAQVKPDGNPSVQLEWRLDAACDAYRRKHVPVIVCGAQGKDEPETEAETMKHFLTEKGIPEEDVLTDPDSFNTMQNLKNAAHLLEKMPEIRKVLIVTSDYHVPRSLAIAKDLGFDARGLGSPCKQEYWLKNHTREALAWCKYWAKKYLRLPVE